MPTQEEVARGATNNAGRNGKTRGSVNNKNRLEAFKTRAGQGGADWGSCDPRWMQAVVCEMQRVGGAITFGLSRDGGAHCLTLLLDGNRETLWFNGDADLDVELEAVFATLETL